MSVYSILIALILDYTMGDPAWSWHPVRMLGHLISWLEPLCRRLPMKPKAQGTVFLLLTLAISLMPVGAILSLSLFLQGPFLIAAESLMIYFALGGTCLAREVAGVAYALNEDGLAGGRERIRMLVSRDTKQMSESDVVSSAIETLAENFSDSACATLLYAALGGPALAWIHRISNTLDAMVGYMTPEYKEFGWASAKFDDLLNFIPSRLSAFLIALVSPSVDGNIRLTLEQIQSDGRALPSPNSGYPIAAFAGALRTRLCGPTYYFGTLKDKPYIGIGVRPDLMDLMSSLGLYWNAYALTSLVAIGLMAVIGMLGVYWNMYILVVFILISCGGLIRK